MSVKNKSKQPQPQPRSTAPQIVGVDVAPVLNFDGAISMGARDGVINIDLGTTIYQPNVDGTVTGKIRAVAFLRCNAQTAKALIDIIAKAVEMHQTEVLARKKARMQAKAKPKPATPEAERPTVN